MKTKRQKGKGEILIYIVMTLWVVFGIMAIKFNSNLTHLAGYYTSLTLFVGTYLWGEYKRTDNKTTIFKKGPNSSREIVIYITVLLWTILGLFGIIKAMNINNLTVYFSALSPFVTSYIIYKTAKGADLPIFNSDTQNLINKSKEGDDKTVVTQQSTEKTVDTNKVEQPNVDLQTLIAQSSANIDKENQTVIPKGNIEVKDEPVG